MEHGTHDAVRVVAGALVRRGRVLVARRGPDMGLAGRWELPGGKVEPGETDTEALVRELHEELLVEVAVHHRLGESVHGTGPRRIQLIAYRCTLRAGTPQAVEHAEVRWVGPDELDALGWAPADIALLGAVKAECAL